MSEKRIKLIDDMINGIDEKYTDSAAERLFGITPAYRELEEIIVEPQAPEKHGKLYKALSFVLPTAAVLALIVGGVKFISMLPEISNIPAQTSVSTTPEAPHENKDDDNHKTIGEKKFTDHCSVQLIEKDGALSFKTENMYTGDVKTFSAGVSIPDGVSSQCVLRQLEFGQNDVLALFVPKADDNELYEAHLYRLKVESVTHIKDTVDLSRVQPRLMKMSEQGNIRFYGEDDKLINACISFGDDTLYNWGMTGYDNDERVIDTTTLKFSDGIDLARFEKAFYGKWQAINGEKVINLTYYGDRSFEPWTTYTGGICETERGWFMRGIEGGEPLLSFVPKIEDTSMPSSVMLVYSAPDGVKFKLSEYMGAYTRMTEKEEYDGTLHQGALTSAGIAKLKALTGCDIDLSPEEVTSGNTSKYRQQQHKGFGIGNFYLIGYDKDNIGYTARYHKASLDLANENPNVKDFRFIYLYMIADKSSGKWEIALVNEHDYELHGSDGIGDTEYLKAAKKLVAEEQNAGNVNCDLNIHVDCDLPTYDGRYFACRRMGTTNLSEKNYLNEYYYFDGVKYNMVGRCDISKYMYVSYCMYNDILYFLATGDNGERLLSASDGKHTGSIELSFSSEETFITAGYAGDYTYVRVTDYKNDKDAFYIANVTPFNIEFLPLENCELTQDGTMDRGGGFAATMREDSAVKKKGSKITYNVNNTLFTDRLWQLDYELQTAWRYLNIAENSPDSNDAIYSDSGAELGYICDYSDMYNYLCRTFTSGTAKSIIYDNFNVVGGKLYAAYHGPRGGYLEGEVTAKTQISENEASITYTESGTGRTCTVGAVRTSGGWRLTDFVSLQ